MSDSSIVSYNLDDSLIKKLSDLAKQNKRSASKELEVILESVLE